MSRLLRPGILLLNQLRYPQKFLLISLLMAIPLVLTISLLLSETQPRIEFTSRELAGSRYIRGLGQLLEEMQQSHAYSYTADPETLTNYQTKIAASITALNHDQSNQQMFATDKPVQQLRRLHTELQSALKSNDDERIDLTHIAMVEAIQAEISRVGDASNLILDPELTTYYLMNIAVVQSPQQLYLLAKAHHLLEENQHNPNAATNAELIALAGQLNASAAETRRAVEIASANDPLIAAALTAQLSDSLTNISVLSNALLSTDTQSQLSAEASINLGLQTSAASQRLARSALNELDIRLQQRVKLLTFKNRLAFGAAGILVIIMIYLLAGFYVAIMHAIKTLDRASQQLRDGDTAHPVVLKTRDELGQIVISFNRVIAVLADESSKRQAAVDQQSRLQQEIIQAQEANLDALAAPLIPLTQQVALLALVGSIDQRRAQHILNTLLQGVANLRSQTVIIDMSGVRVVDTQVAQLLIRSATGARMLGAHVVLSGLSAEVAQTIVHLGVEFGDIDFHASLQDALEEHIGHTTTV